MVGWLVEEFSAYHASFFPKPQIPLESEKLNNQTAAQGWI